jgi:hypothetical protein
VLAPQEAIDSVREFALGAVLAPLTPRDED